MRRRAWVNHERGTRTDDDADIRDEPDVPVRNHIACAATLTVAFLHQRIGRLLLRTDALPDDGGAVGCTSSSSTAIARSRSRRRRAPPPLAQRQGLQPHVSGGLPGLAKLPNETVIDGEIVAFDDEAVRRSTLLQNYGSATGPILYYVFDVMVLAGRDVMSEPLETRRAAARAEGAAEARRAGAVRRRRSTRRSPCSMQSVKAQRLRGAGREAPRQPLRTGPAIGRVAEDARQPGAGVRDRRLHGRHAAPSTR